MPRWLPILLAGLATLPGFAHAEPLVDRARLESWADAYFGQAVAERRSPGITISVVQDGEIILAKGYGYSDYDQRIPVDAGTSGFMTGSISKTFIATAIGQLIDRGAIRSLDDPANRYLRRVQLPGERGARVTIRHLLTHRAGFEDVTFGSGLAEGHAVPVPLSAEEIRRHMPELVMEPGGPSVYSNWGFAVLGFLIEDVSGQRLDTYLREHVWAPLGMHHTGILYGDRWPDNINASYFFEKDGTPVARPIRGGPHPWIAAPGMVVSTARDMALYMNAHLSEGENGGHPLLSREMFRQLHTEWVRNAPGGAGFAGAFFTGQLNGAPTIEHGGSTFDTHSMMTMIPAKRFGFFVAAMQGGLAPRAGDYSPEEIAAGKALVRDPLTPAELRESFIDRFLERPVEVAHGRQLDLHKLAGTYRATRRPYTTIAVISEAFNPAAVHEVQLTSDGQGLLLNGAGPYTQLGNGLFRSPSGANEWTDPYTIDHRLPPHIAFNVDAAGNPVYLVVGHGDQVWVPASPIFNARFMVPAAGILGIIAASGLLLFAWPQRRRFANPTNYLGLGALLLVLAIPGAMMLGFARNDSIVVQAILGRMTRFQVMVAAANAMILVAALLVFRAVSEWRAAGAPGLPAWAHRGRQLQVGAVALSCCGLLEVFAFFNLLGLNLPAHAESGDPVPAACRPQPGSERRGPGDCRTPLDTQLSARLQQILDAARADPAARYPGAILHIETPQGSWSGVSGVANIANGSAIDPAAKFRCGSILKPFISTVILQLVEEGRLSLEDRLPDLLPPDVVRLFQHSEEITVRMLLNHTSGIGEWVDQLDRPAILRDSRHKVWSELEFLRMAASKGARFRPGTRWLYNNTEYNLLGMIIERRTGLPWRENVRRRVITRLGLRNTVLPEPGTPTMPGSSISGYAAYGGAVTEVSDLDPSMAGAAGGHALVSNAEDLATFLQALLAGALFERPESLATMLAGVDTGVPFRRSYGLGIGRYELPDGSYAWGHTGGTAGYASIVLHFPEHAITLSAVISMDQGAENMGFLAPAFRALVDSQQGR